MIVSSAARRRFPVSDQPDRAVIDIGSNTVRLVVYSGPPRAPNVWLNEKVTARLGRDLSVTGRMPDKAMDLALSALGRYAALLPDLGVRNLDTVATAAVRDAENGAEFLDRVSQLGLAPRLLSGEEEALTSAMGVVGAFPAAIGTVADLGGGSLELVQVENGQLHDAASLQLGTLRLPKLREPGMTAFRKSVGDDLKRVGWASAHPGPLYMVGGTWRALAAFAMRRDNHPVTDPHGFRMSCEDADATAKQIMRLTPAQLSPIPGISSSRAAGLPDAAALLRVMLAKMKPDGLVFSSWGLREGLLFDRLSQGAREQDPLTAAVSHFVAPRGGSATLATTIAAWTTPVAGGSGHGSERLRLTATMFALAAAQVEPNHRARHAYEWAMEKRWLTLSPSDRARIAAALLASCGRIETAPELARIATAEQLREAVGWGLAIRLCRRLGAGSRVSLLSSSLHRDGDKLILRIDPARAALVSDIVRNDCKALAQWLGLQHEIVFAENVPD